jgi:hypothetical protein
MAVLLITRSPSVHESVVPLCAAAEIGAEVCADPGLSLAPWREADLVLVGSDLAGAVASLGPPRRLGVHLVAAPPDESAFRHAVALGADSVVELPEGAPWLTDVGERGLARQDAAGRMAPLTAVNRLRGRPRDVP